MLRKLFAIAVLVFVSACGGGGDGSPTAPSPSTQTRVMHIDGSLDFGDVRVGESSERTIRVFNNGNSPMTVSSLTVPSGGGFSASWLSGTIPANGAFQDITVRFSPTEARSYGGTFTVVANQTSGPNTLAITARGMRDLFVKTGRGNDVFDMPVDVRRIRIYGRWDGRSTSNFIVRIDGSTVVNAILRDRNPYEGLHLIARGGVVEIRNSEGIEEWRFTEER